MNKKILVSVNTTWNIVNYRSNLIKEIVNRGYDVICASTTDGNENKLKELGCRYISFNIEGSKINPFYDILLIYKYFKLLKEEDPCIYMSFTSKPNIFGSIAAHILGIPVINNISGLGVVFTKDDILTKIVKILYKISLRRSKKVFFQNNDDKELFINKKIVTKTIADILPGSGVDLERFKIVELKSNIPRFLFIGRLLWEKGIKEYVEAAIEIKKKYDKVQFFILGYVDVNNPSAVKKENIDEFEAKGAIKYLGSTSDVTTILSNVECVVLPSYYREGVPKVLIEAAAMGRPIITTNAIGCKEVVEDKKNGFLCEIKNKVDLVDKIEKIINLSEFERAEMGRYGRNKMELEYNEEIIINKYLKVISEIFQRRLNITKS
jgi:glycosyltransferase involved in cell wall biosynthesis